MARFVKNKSSISKSIVLLFVNSNIDYHCRMISENQRIVSIIAFRVSHIVSPIFVSRAIWSRIHYDHDFVWFYHVSIKSDTRLLYLDKSISFPVVRYSEQSVKSCETTFHSTSSRWQEITVIVLFFVLSRWYSVPCI